MVNTDVKGAPAMTGIMALHPYFFMVVMMTLAKADIRAVFFDVNAYANPIAIE